MSNDAMTPNFICTMLPSHNVAIHDIVVVVVIIVVAKDNHFGSDTKKSGAESF